MTIDPIVCEFDEELSPAERDLIERARDFGRRVVVPQCAAWERERRVPIDALKAAAAEGLCSVEVPESVGGSGMRFSAKLRMVEELARFDFAFPFLLVNHHNATRRVAEASAPVAERLLPAMLRAETIGCSAYTEPGCGSDLAALTTSAAKSAAGWKLNGRKTWITGAAVADVFVTLAQTQPGSRGRGLATFIVEANCPGFARDAPLAMQGGHAIGAGGFQLMDYVASDESLLDPPGGGFQRAIGGINGARTYVAAMCAGMLASALEWAVRYAGSRTAFGKPLLDFQGLRWSLVDAEADLAALRLVTYRAARRIDAGLPADEDAARAKKMAGERTVGHLAACIQALGARGILEETPLSRHLLAAKIACFTDGTTEMMNERLGKLLAERITGASDPA